MDEYVNMLSYSCFSLLLVYVASDYVVFLFALSLLTLLYHYIWFCCAKLGCWHVMFAFIASEFYVRNFMQLFWCICFNMVFTVTLCCC